MKCKESERKSKQQQQQEEKTPLQKYVDEYLENSKSFAFLGYGL